MEYKDTLQMPKTDFEMRGKLPTKEGDFQARWKAMKLYELMLEERKDAKKFILHDGPPYANGDIHLGHALNKILKDIILRTRYMSGYQVPFISGWDTHGLPIETAIQKLGHDRKNMALADFRKLCLEYATEQVKIQKQGFESLGLIGDFEKPYITFQKSMEAEQIRIFGKMAQKGLIYKGCKPVYWSPSSESALAEAEIEYQDIKSPAIYVKFPIKDSLNIIDQDASFVIWTTTPWTIPANLAICLNKNFTYALVESEKGKLIVLEDKVDELWELFECKTKNILKTFKGEQLEMITCSHPLYNKESLVILGDHVSKEAGTGCVHTAPGFGTDDFYVGAKYGLEPYCNVDAQGYLTAESGDFLVGQYVDDANKTVTKRLDELGVLLKLEFITHAYPHDWRTKKPIIFRATTQWFASIDQIREQLLTQIDKVDWIPQWGKLRMHNMIVDRSDWCISRQRAWGVPIPIFYGEDDTPIIDEQIFAHVAQLFEEYGSNIWYEKSAKELLPQGYTHPSAPNQKFTKENDTMDVWFDSGSTHTGVLLKRGQPFPADLYFEGSDQYRGWFNSSLIISVAIHGIAPFKQVLSHGFVMDGKGAKMSKSQWNAVAPSQINQKYGADILRLWAAGVDYQADSTMSDEILKQVSENYRKIRNTFRFLLANLDDLKSIKEQLVPIDELPKKDRYMMIRLKAVNEAVQKAYNEYRFSDASNLLINVMSNEFSSYYLDYTKDILYIEAKQGKLRRQVQSVLYHAIQVFIRLWAPILVHTCEELNDFLQVDKRSIHLTSFITMEKIKDEGAIHKDMERLFLIRSDIFKALEEARAEKIIGKSLEACVHLQLSDTDKAVVDEYFESSFHQWLIVSKVEYSDEVKHAFDTCKVSITPCEGSVCPRCWNITKSQFEDGLCDRCDALLNAKSSK